jgi:hypothetical protein
MAAQAKKDSEKFEEMNQTKKLEVIYKDLIK